MSQRSDIEPRSIGLIKKQHHKINVNRIIIYTDCWPILENQLSRMHTNKINEDVNVSYREKGEKKKWNITVRMMNVENKTAINNFVFILASYLSLTNRSQKQMHCN